MPFAVGSHHHRAGAEIHLRLLGRLHLNPPDQFGLRLSQPADIPFDRLIRTLESNLRLQILENSLGAQPVRHLHTDQRIMIFTQAFSPCFPGGRKRVNLKPFISTPDGSI